MENQPSLDLALAETSLNPTNNYSLFYSELPNCFILADYSGLIDHIVDQYMSLNNKKTIVFKIGRRPESLSSNCLRFQKTKTEEVIDFLFKELQLRESDAIAGDKKFAGKKADLLLVIYHINSFDHSLSTADSTQEGTTSFKFKKIIEKGKTLGIGVIASQLCSVSNINIKENIDVFFNTHYTLSFNEPTNQFEFIPKAQGEITQTFYVSYRPDLEKSALESKRRNLTYKEEQPFNKAYQLLLLSDKLDFSEQTSEIKTFRIQYRLGLTSTGIAEGLRAIYT
jgi:hypothetical protein